MFVCVTKASEGDGGGVGRYILSRLYLSLLKILHVLLQVVLMKQLLG